ncbi:hypothetical protein FOZ60_013583 [Perkinsus olseni]|uniref:Uncharacterized protein n=1 Tax=Perkinsus olseni TaxID=32597 RepID=A0A7J6N8Z7_PEROL|nr:hypothetical protein FOZ60_013583 [Perkinsus olseni]
MEDSGNTTKALHVDCGGHIYTMDEDGQGFIEVGSHKSKLDFEDPLKEMNGDLFAQLPNCHEILAELRRTLLQESPEDSPGSKGEAVSSFTSPSARLEDGDFDDDNNLYIYDDPDLFPLVIMQTFIIWIASVICLMIHIPPGYGAAAFNSDNDEDPMEASEVQPMKPRRGPETFPARKRLQTNSFSLRKQQQGSHQEMPIERRSPSSDVCRVVEERVGGDDSSAVMCSLRDTRMNSLRYTNLKLAGSHRVDQTVSVVCDDKTYWITDGHIQEIDTGGVDYSLYLTDPLLWFNRRASKMSCSSIFRALQTEVLERGSAVDEGDMTLYNNEDPMEVDNGPFTGLGKHHARGGQQTAAHGYSSPPAASSSRRKRKSHEPDGTQAKKRMLTSNLFSALLPSRMDACGAAPETDVECTPASSGEETSVNMCLIPFTTSAGLAYTTNPEGQGLPRTMIVSCDDEQYTIADDSIVGVLEGDAFREVQRDDPRQEFNSIAFSKPCTEIFRDVQRELLPTYPVQDVLRWDMCEKLITYICGVYRAAVRSPPIGPFA